MLLFIGGAARTGKGILVRRLLAEMRMSYLSVDVLKMGLARGVPEFGIDPDAGPIVVAEKLWPLIREMTPNLIEEGIPYAVEGEILPKHIDEIRRGYPSDINACFLGYADITPAQKLQEIRAYPGFPNDWSSETTDTHLLMVITEMITFSHYLKEECEIYNFPYFDTSTQFEQTLDEVVAYVKHSLERN